ncbi:MAG: GNAT family N-acetyltransferase [Microscillaceae bacterium]|nr:GNAT family N-acetyltransferase [Microscillaceae bacterium]
MNLEIVKLTHDSMEDFYGLIRVFENVFEWEGFTLPSKTHLQKVLENPNFLVFVAKKDATVVGGLTVYVLDRYDTEKPSAYLYDLAVLTDLQRKGIGKLLITTLNDFCEKNGFEEVYVQAETDDFQAVNFYRTTPISGELKAIHFTYSLGENTQHLDE